MDQLLVIHSPIKLMNMKVTCKIQLYFPPATIVRKWSSQKEIIYLRQEKKSQKESYNIC